MVEPTKVVCMGESPEHIARDYESTPLVLIYPRTGRPSSRILLKKNVVRIFSDYQSFPDIESLEIVRDTLMYLLNVSVINSSDRVLFIFEKNGERYELFFDMRKLKLPTLMDMLSDRIDRSIVESMVKLSMSVVKKGKEGYPAGALFIVGDIPNVMRYVVQKIANPVKGIDRRMRNVLYHENFDTIRELAVMDGATLVDEEGYLVAAGVYVKNLGVGECIVDGYGGRHLAARSISRLTKAISFAISTEGSIRVYCDGKMIYELKDF